MAFVRGIGVTPASAPIIPLFKGMGATAVRTWGVDQLTPELMEACRVHGLAISAGLWIETVPDSPELQKAAAAQLVADARAAASNPAVTSYIVGNEVEIRTQGKPLASVFSFINQCGLAVASATGKPVTTALAGSGYDKVTEASAALGGLNCLTVNAYAEAPALPLHMRAQGSTQPYLVGEFMSAGPWEVSHAHVTEWGAPLEPTSTEKAADTAAAYASFLSDPACKGAFAFLGAHKYETTPTWFGLLAWDGRMVADRAWVLREAWGLTAAAEAAAGVAPAAPYADTIPSAPRFIPSPDVIEAIRTELPRRLLTAPAVPHCLALTAGVASWAGAGGGGASGRRAAPVVVPAPLGPAAPADAAAPGPRWPWLPPPGHAVQVPQGGLRAQPGALLTVTLWFAAAAAAPAASLGWKAELYFSDPPRAPEPATLLLDPLSEPETGASGWTLAGSSPFAGTPVVPLTYTVAAPVQPGAYRLTALVSLVARGARDLRPLPPREGDTTNLARTGRILQEQGGGQVATASLPVLVTEGGAWGSSGGGGRALLSAARPVVDHLGKHASNCSLT